MEDGRVAGLVCQRMTLGDFDRSGRRRPVPVEGAEFTLDVETVIPAIGQQIETTYLDVEVEKGKVRVDRRTLSTSLPHVFAGLYGWPDDSSNAIADGHQAAQTIQLSVRRTDAEAEACQDPGAGRGPHQLERGRRRATSSQAQRILMPTAACFGRWS